MTSHSTHFEQLAHMLADRHEGHAVILYGSHATGNAVLSSDVDLLVLRENPRRTRDSSDWHDLSLDAFIEPDTLVPDERWVHVHNGIVLLDRKGRGLRFLTEIKALYAKGPRPKTPEEIDTSRTWVQKMCARIESEQSEIADYRRVVLMAEMLPLWFEWRALWFPGPKTALSVVRSLDENFAEAYARAIRPGAAVDELFHAASLLIIQRSASTRTPPPIR